MPPQMMPMQDQHMISNQTVGHQMGHTPQLPPPVQYPDGATQQQFPMQVPGQS